MWKVVALIGLMGSPLMAETISTGHIGCANQAALKEVRIAASEYDNIRITEMLDSGLCFSIGGLQYKMLDKGFVTSKVRVFVGSKSAILYVMANATK
jgi:hypothetical protein